MRKADFEKALDLLEESFLLRMTSSPEHKYRDMELWREWDKKTEVFLREMRGMADR